MRRCFHLLLWCCAWGAASALLHASGAAFDLSGPKVDVHVKRGAVTLPISEASNLLPGDRLWIHPDLPTSQSERFVLVVAFLRGSTNPPPPEWFTRVETWTRAARDEGVFVTVPAGAEQALLFLAPATGGGFNTLRKAVEDQPGSFVRAAQDLQAASWERMRLNAYLADVKVTSLTNPKKLQARAERSARSLGIKINEDCFAKPSDQQASCLSQDSEGMVLDDSNAQSLVNQLANGETLNLVNALSTTRLAGGGAYSPYVGAVVDIAQILGSLHTAHYQYIPALALPAADALNLRLNMPPSFRNPKSVVVVALPSIAAVRPEPLRPVNLSMNLTANLEGGFCALKPGLVLPAEGAPLVFATALAHDLTLRITAQDGSPGRDVPGGAVPDHAIQGRAVPDWVINVPVKADSAAGGLVPVDALPRLPAGELTAVLHGQWGFDDWEGPRYVLFSPQPDQWTPAPGDRSALVVGRADTVHLQGESTLCVEKVEGQAGKGHAVNLVWKPLTPDSMAVTVPLQDAAPGAVRLEVYQYGLRKSDRIEMTAYAVAASLEGLSLNAGDTEALLKGTRLDEVAKASVNGIAGIAFTPATLSRAGDLDQLVLKVDQKADQKAARQAARQAAQKVAQSTSGLEPGTSYTATVELKDGRQLSVPVTVNPPRPAVTLLSEGVQGEGVQGEGVQGEGVQGDASALPAPVVFGSPSDLPVDRQLVFFLRSGTPANFPLDEKVEVAVADSSLHTVLSFTDGGLMLEDASTVVGKLEPLTRFGPSAFGPLEVRAVAADGVAGQWLPLGTLVRLPDFKKLRCPRSLAEPCILSGTNLFLADAIAATPDFEAPADVPPEFTGAEIQVPHPANGVLYLKLRDDPKTVQTLTLAITYPPRLVPPPVTPPVAPSALPPVTSPVAPATSAGATSPAAPTVPAAPSAAPANPPASPSVPPSATPAAPSGTAAKSSAAPAEPVNPPAAQGGETQPDAPTNPER